MVIPDTFIDPVVYQSTEIKLVDEATGEFQITHIFLRGGKKIYLKYPKVKIEIDNSRWPVLAPGQPIDPMPFDYTVLINENTKTMAELTFED